jgi:hypothetical protein
LTKVRTLSVVVGTTFFESKRVDVLKGTATVSGGGRSHRFANVVYEGWNPRLPYQAW